MESSLEVLRSRIRGGFTLKVAAMESALKVLETRICASDPRKVIERGYALVLDAQGRDMKGVDGRKVGDRVSMMFADGEIDCLIENVR
jgi:exonuclease VII large subunit